MTLLTLILWLSPPCQTCIVIDTTKPVASICDTVRLPECDWTTLSIAVGARP